MTLRAFQPLSVPTFQTSRHPLSFGPLSSPLLPNHPIEYLLPPSLTLNCPRQALHHYCFTLTLLEDALEAFLSGRYEQFDALIGNNSCHIVAYLVFWIGKREATTPFIQKSLQHVRILKNKALIVLQKEIPTHQTFEELLEVHQLHLEIATECLFLAMAYGCAISKQKNERNIEQMCYKRLEHKYRDNSLFEVKKKPLVSCIKHWQRIISHLNIAILQAHSLPGYVGPSSRYLFGDFIKADDRNRLCAPSIFAVQTILDLIQSIPGALIGIEINVIRESQEFVGKSTVFFRADSTGRFKATEKTHAEPVYIVAGCRYIASDAVVDMAAIQAEFQQRDLRELITAHEVTYPQYPKSLGVPNIEPSELSLRNEFDRLKRKRGFSLQDPSDFCVAHIFIANPQHLDPTPTFLPKLIEKIS